MRELALVGECEGGAPPSPPPSPPPPSSPPSPPPSLSRRAGVRRWNPPYEERFVLGPTAKGIRNDGTIDEGVLEDGQTNL